MNPTLVWNCFNDVHVAIVDKFNVMEQISILMVEIDTSHLPVLNQWLKCSRHSGLLTQKSGGMVTLHKVSFDKVA